MHGSSTSARGGPSLRNLRNFPGADLAWARGGATAPPLADFLPLLPPPGGQSQSQKYPKNKQEIALKRSIFQKIRRFAPHSDIFLKICSKTAKFRQNFVFLSIFSKIFQNFAEKFENFPNFSGKFEFKKLVFAK